MNIGILGTGYIAEKLSYTINNLDGFTNYAIASRNIEKANNFKEKYNFVKAYGSYLELLEDENVDLVYIATPHSEHFNNMKMCIEKKKNILCEKAFTLNYAEAKEITDLSKKNNVFIAEALWTSYMPFNSYLSDLLKNEKIQKIKAVFAINIIEKERIYKKSLGGGALLDLGVYPISFVLRLLGFNYDRIDVNQILYGKTNVDLNESITFVYGDIEATCISDVTIDKGCYVKITTDKNEYYIDSCNNPRTITISGDKIDLQPQITGYEYELINCKECIEKGLKEASLWNIDNTLNLMKILDEIQK